MGRYARLLLTKTGVLGIFADATVLISTYIFTFYSLVLNNYNDLDFFKKRLSHTLSRSCIVGAFTNIENSYTQTTRPGTTTYYHRSNRTVNIVHSLRRARRGHGVLVSSDASYHRTRLLRYVRVPYSVERNARVSPLCGPSDRRGGAYGGGASRLGGAPPSPPGGDRRR